VKYGGNGEMGETEFLEEKELGPNLVGIQPRNFTVFPIDGDKT
jgi:hypothetical protein